MAPTCSSSAQDQSHTGKPGVGTLRRPLGLSTGLLTAAGDVGGQTTNGSLSAAAPGSCGLQHYRAGQLRPQAARGEGLAPGTRRPPSLIPASPEEAAAETAPPRACTALPEDKGECRGWGSHRQLALGLSLTILRLKSSSPRSLGPQLCAEAGAPGVSPTLAGSCALASSSPDARQETPDPDNVRGPGSGAPK